MATTDKLIATDACTLSIDKVKFPVPVGTEIIVHKGGFVNGEAEFDGDATATVKQNITTGIIKGIVLRIKSKTKKKWFDEQASLQGQTMVLDNGNAAYTIPSGAIMCPATDSSIGFSNKNLTTEAFDIRSLIGKVRES